jgi:hypothetical protein
VIGGFQELIGHMPWCIGAIDGTHVAMRKPDTARWPQGRDMYYSWKSKISMLLVWIVDARGRALYATTGDPGSTSDAGVWGRDALRNELQRGRLSSPQKELVVKVAGEEQKMSISPYLVGDGAFVLQPYMMKCYPHDNTHAERVFNQAVCDVRKVVEQAIGRLKMCWQFCHKNVWHGDTKFVKACIEACVGLHNFRMDYNVSLDDEIVAEFVRKEVSTTAPGAAQDVADQAEAPQQQARAQQIRDFLATYLVHNVG